MRRREDDAKRLQGGQVVFPSIDKSNVPDILARFKPTQSAAASRLLYGIQNYLAYLIAAVTIARAKRQLIDWRTVHLANG